MIRPVRGWNDKLLPEHRRGLPEALDQVVKAERDYRALIAEHVRIELLAQAEPVVLDRVCLAYSLLTLAGRTPTSTTAIRPKTCRRGGRRCRAVPGSGGRCK
jgi:hypothetical protein